MSAPLDHRDYARSLPWREAVAGLRDLAADFEREGEYGLASVALQEAVYIATADGADAASIAGIWADHEALTERGDAATEATP
jgi:hypothetical protein